MTVLAVALTFGVLLLPMVVGPFAYSLRQPRPEGLTWRKLLFARDRRLTQTEQQWRLEESMWGDVAAFVLLTGLAIGIGLAGVGKQPATTLLPVLLALVSARDAYRRWRGLGPLSLDVAAPRSAERLMDSR